MAAVATAGAATPAAAPAPAPAPGGAPVPSASAGAEGLVWVITVAVWVVIALVQAAACARAPCSLLLRAGAGEGGLERGAEGWWVPLALGGAVAASFYAQLDTRWGRAAALHLPLHAQVAGLLLGFGAAALFASTHWHLGSLWIPSVTLPAREPLVTHGPFGMVRHPLYASLCLMAAFALLAPGWVLVAAALAAAAAFCALVRAPAEEAALARAHGDAWRAYIRRTPGMLLPWREAGGGGGGGGGGSGAGGAESAPLLRVDKSSA